MSSEIAPTFVLITGLASAIASMSETGRFSAKLDNTKPRLDSISWQISLLFFQPSRAT
jgi:hypothetical protein